MNRTRNLFACAVVLAAIFPATAHAQCGPDDGQVDNLFGYGRDLGTGPEQLWVDRRSWYNIPLTTVSEVEVVFDPAICGPAGSAYQQHYNLPGLAPNVYVVRVGARYIVLDPTFLQGEFQSYLVLDLSFNVISSWAG